MQRNRRIYLHKFLSEINLKSTIYLGESQDK